MSNFIRLMSSDFFVVNVPEVVAYTSQTIKNLTEDTGSQEIVPLPNVSSRVLSKVIEYSTYHVDAVEMSKSATETSAWDAEYVSMEQATLFDVIVAADYLDIKGLLDLTCQAVANMLRCKTPDEVREALNMKNDFAPDEEEQLRCENEWAFVML